MGYLWGSFDRVFSRHALPPSEVNRMFPTRMRLAAMRRLPETGWDLRIASPSRPQLPEDLEYRVADVSQTLEAQEVEWPGDSDIPIRFRRAGATLRILQNVPRIATGH